MGNLDDATLSEVCGSLAFQTCTERGCQCHPSIDTDAERPGWFSEAVAPLLSATDDMAPEDAAEERRRLGYDAERVVTVVHESSCPLSGVRATMTVRPPAPLRVLIVHEP